MFQAPYQTFLYLNPLREVYVIVSPRYVTYKKKNGDSSMG